MSPKYTIEDYQRAGTEIYEKLHLSTLPVGVKYIRDESEIPEGVRRPVNEGQKMSLCQCFTQSRRFSEKWALMAVDNFCTPMTTSMGWVKLTQEELLESQIRQGWHSDKESEKKAVTGSSMTGSSDQKGRELLAKQGYRGLISVPLDETPIIPDSILIYGTPVKITYIIHALAFEKRSKYEIKTSFMGFGESCVKGTLMPLLLQKPQIVIPGTGDRSFCGIQDWEVAIGLPSKHIFYVLENLFKTGRNQGLKLPLRQIIPRLDENITPGFKYLAPIIEKKLKEEAEASK